ncbi:MAG TPA: formate dehydrogenase subunit delta, partial [Methylomirabilota bacterium]|nr:formate dehydrogenase subunit delta [Methylomirabilota bacterium]
TAPAKLVTMANQITRNLAAEGEARAVPQIAAHIVAFWDPRMRAAIAAHVAVGGEGLDPLALKALERVPAPGDARG